MKIIEFKEYKNVSTEKKINKKKVAIAISCLVLILIGIIIFSVYICSSNFRNFMDQYILGKVVMENKVPYIDLDISENPNVYAFNKKIVVLNKNKLKQYDTSGKETSELEINISNPIFESKDRFLLIAEKEKKKLYFIKDNRIAWEKDLEGEISKTTVNKNGYTAVVIGGTTYKSVIIMFDEQGKELFKTYLSNSIATDITISEDNKYLAFAEIDTSGTLINQKIKVISIENAKTFPDKAIINTAAIGVDELVVDIEYQDKNKLVCLGNTAVYEVIENSVNKIEDLNSGISKISFAGISLNKHIYRIQEIIYGTLDQASNVEITNTISGKKNVYTIKGIAKKVSCCENVIVVNLGNEVYFVSTNGWLIKKYCSNQDVLDVIVSDNIAGIVYKNKIEIISL